MRGAREVHVERGTHLADATGMVKSGLVITFAGPACETSFRGAVSGLEAAEELWCGKPIGALLPVVIASESERSGAELLRELERLPGIQKVDVVAIDFGSEENVEEQA